MSVGSSSFTPLAKPFTPSAPKPREPTPPPKDIIADKFKLWKHSERETNDFKDIITKLGSRKDSEPISLEIFKQI